MPRLSCLAETGAGGRESGKFIAVVAFSVRERKAPYLSYLCSFVRSFLPSFVRSLLPSDHLSFSGSSDSKKPYQKFLSPSLPPPSSLLPPHLPQRFIFWRFFRCCSRPRRRSPISSSWSQPQASLSLTHSLSLSRSFPFQVHRVLG